MMNNIVFVDLDGPFFSDAVIAYHPDQRLPFPGDASIAEKIPYWRMDELSRIFWTQLHKSFKFQSVISSSWTGILPERDNFISLFDANGIPIELHDDWRTPPLYLDRGCPRAARIHAWLQAHPEVENFVIIDDIFSGRSLVEGSEYWKDEFEYMKDRIVFVNTDSGLGSMAMGRIIYIMKSWSKE